MFTKLWLYSYYNQQDTPHSRLYMEQKRYEMPHFIPFLILKSVEYGVKAIGHTPLLTGNGAKPVGYGVKATEYALFLIGNGAFPGGNGVKNI